MMTNIVVDKSTDNAEPLSICFYQNIQLLFPHIQYTAQNTCELVGTALKGTKGPKIQGNIRQILTQHESEFIGAK